jgi:Pentapeptide repeats (8 copies)
MTLISRPKALKQELRGCFRQTCEADAIGGDLSGAKLFKCTMVGARLSDADLAKVDMTQAEMSGAFMDGGQTVWCRSPWRHDGSSDIGRGRNCRTESRAISDAFVIAA